MRLVEVITLLGFNILIVMVMQHFHGRNLERRLKRVSQEIRELEDLVAAIIEEFEEVAGLDEASNEELGMANQPMQVQESKATYQPMIIQEPENIDRPVVVNDPAMAFQPVDSLQDVAVSAQAEENGQSVDDKRQQVLALHSQGMEVADIARKMGIGVGEVKLILGLYQRS
ncbi:MAG TPA: hypothetical protein PLC07_08945 [Bacillota bacterium]|nr:hypothetical protein [Bacillota bacterium]HPT87882.1 hypothetical protein [Bacillota bacterium]